MAALGLCCCVSFSLVVVSRDYSLFAEQRLLIAVVSVVGEKPLVEMPHGGMWHLPGPGVKPVSPALAGGLFTTEPPGKPWALLLKPRPKLTPCS